MRMNYSMDHTYSETSTLVGDDETLLNQLSPNFTVGPTKYGGRGCFAINSIAAGVEIFAARSPLASTITKPFKKEVCTYCFAYDNGKTLKCRKSLSKGKTTVSLYFCSPTCQAHFEEEDPEEVLFDSLMAVEVCQKPNDPEEIDVVLESDTIDKEWANAGQWRETINRMKPSKRSSQIPHISASDYMEAKYVIGVLARQYYLSNDIISNKEMSVADNREAQAMELAMFHMLQSTDREKVEKYPYLLKAYVNIFKLLYLVVHPELQKYVTPDAVRHIIGRNLSNAFGIWSAQEARSDDREFFGFGVFPSASFFNHSCEPNIIKKRVGRKLTFTTTREVANGEELCIDYGNYINEPVAVRQQQLAEWFFACGCTKCSIELNQ